MTPNMQESCDFSKINKGYQTIQFTMDCKIRKFHSYKKSLKDKKVPNSELLTKLNTEKTWLQADIQRYSHDFNSYNYLTTRIAGIEDKSKLLQELFKLKYDRNNRASTGSTMNNARKRRLKEICHFLYYQKEKFQGSRFLWYTFTVPPFHNSSIQYEPEKHDELFQKQFLKLLDNLRKNHGLKSYIWVAERQTGKRKKDGGKATNTIHFHCIFIQSKNSYLNVENVNLYWLQLCHQLGCRAIIKDISKTKEGKIRKLPSFFVPMLKNHMYGEFLRRPMAQDITKNRLKQLGLLVNPVKASGVANLRSLGSYIAKYISKNDEKVFCRSNGMTKDLSGLSTKIELTQEEAEEIQYQLQDYYLQTYEHPYFINDVKHVINIDVYEPDLMLETCEAVAKLIKIHLLNQKFNPN